MVSALIVTTMLAGAAAALITDSDVINQSVADEELRGVQVRDSNVNNASIAKAAISDAAIRGASIEDVSVKASYLDKVSIQRAHVADSRVAESSIAQSTLEDVTVCNGPCELVSGSGGDRVVHARLPGDAPEKVSPGDSFDLRVTDVEAASLTVRNDPAGTTALGFDPTAADTTIASIELLKGGEVAQTFQLGEAVPLDDDDFTLRVHIAETGVIDGSTLGLVLDLDGRGLRTAMSTVDIVATQLAFAPIEGQAFAPFLADNVARLVISVATDEAGNVDRDLNVSYTVDVKDVDETEGFNVVGDIQEHSYLHGDSEFFSAEPIKYTNPTSPAAHHPATLELILRDTVGLEGITYGAANFYATHLVTQSPFATSVELTASATTADGRELRAGPYAIELGPLPDEERSATTPFGPMGDPTFPGKGTLAVHLVDEAGQPVRAEDGWVLMIQETPDSHQTEVFLALDGEGANFEVPLAASPLVGLPFGDFVPHEYKVCVDHGGETSCANDGALVAIQTGQTTDVSIDVG